MMGCCWFFLMCFGFVLVLYWLVLFVCSFVVLAGCPGLGWAAALFWVANAFFVLSEGLEGCKARPKVEDWLWMRKASQEEVGIVFELTLVYVLV